MVGEERCGAWFWFGIGCCDWLYLGFVILLSLRLLDQTMEQASNATLASMELPTITVVALGVLGLGLYIGSFGA